MTVEKSKIDMIAKSNFDIRLKDGAVTSLKFLRDAFDTQYILRDKRFGDVFVAYRKPNEDWTSLSTLALAQKGLVDIAVSADGSKYDTCYDSDDDGKLAIGLDISFEIDQDCLNYTVHITNQSDQAIEIGDLSIPFPMNSAYEWGTKPHESVLRHAFVSGHNSYMFWMRCNSVGPYLTMTTANDTKLEYFDLYSEEESPKGNRELRAYIHSKAQGQIATEKGTKWRQPHTGALLTPKGAQGDSVTYPFKFYWAKDYDDVRNTIVDEGLIDIQVIPGMTVPNDLFAMFYLRTKQPIESVTPEFPDDTELTYVGKRGDDLHVYKVKFGKLGENLVTVRYGGGKQTYLEFFATEPVETLIHKRAAFIAKTQYRDPSKWYNGLLAEWNMETEVLLGPDNYDRIKGWRIYEVTCDDPGLCKPAYLAAKNAEFPVEQEIEALEYYIEHFVWGGLQRTEQEEYPYGIYGIPDWNVLRSSEDEGPKGKTHIWRIYDYPHIALMYWSMYRVTKNYPHLRTRLSKETYLERAYRTAVAMFTIPQETGEWSAYKTGLYNELIIEDLICELKAVGSLEKAYRLEKHWKKKTIHFVNENADMFGSEYPFDSTGFESTHALAKYAMKHAVKSVGEQPDRNAEEVITQSNAVKFMEAQIEANIFCRGWLSPAYYLYGSDYRGESNGAYTLSYMSQMGGWALLDYALDYSSNPHEYLRLGYASMLSSWALMNTGTPESNYGYWYPGQANDGSAGGGFEPSPFGQTWLEQDHHRGSWYYSCEIDLGFCGALRGAATILADDPIFGLFCYGGDYSQVDGGYEITMKDGVRRRFHVLLGEFKASLHIDTDHISATTPIFVQEDRSEIRFRIESHAEVQHIVTLTVSCLPIGEYGIYVDKSKILSVKGGVEAVVPLIVDTQGATIRVMKE
ncbi:DUF5695 domain-containing protein [Cohnella silvisoli]|uniref:DUF5695 domain-containing protein n=1 Tax=Cohnella silvisoli TaxID=2873699 RepID=A0ABV1KP52_9BACL|nr:DUF5695 domain-containing protein [Cohnella silvisoli]MCD9021124.1 hypothetical protein [Cohnella silvisoli]